MKRLKRFVITYLALTNLFATDYLLATGVFSLFLL